MNAEEYRRIVRLHPVLGKQTVEVQDAVVSLLHSIVLHLTAQLAKATGEGPAKTREY